MKKPIHPRYLARCQRGFSLLELVAVIIILCLLAVATLPRFVNMSDEAHSAQTQATAGAFRSAITLAHARWLADGGIGATVQMDASTVSVTPIGWPGPAGAVSTVACIAVWNGILQDNGPPLSPPPFTPGNNGCAIIPAGVCVYLYQPDTTPFRFIVYSRPTARPSVGRNTHVLCFHPPPGAITLVRA